MDYATVVDQAVKQFYAQGNNEVHSWLLQIQTSPEAWTFVWELLDPSKSWEVQSFAATTLYTKISKQWGEVPKNEYPVLRDRLCNIIRQPSTPKFALTKLCQALAAFMANVSADESEEENKQNVVEELVNMLPYDSLPMLELLVCTLSTLPSELERRHKTKKRKLYECLGNGWRKTAWLLEQVFAMCDPNIQGSNHALHLLAMDCALSWLRFNELPLGATGQIYNHLLLAAAYYAPNREGPIDENNRGWELAKGCLTSIFCFDSVFGWPQTVQNWAHSLVSMAKQCSGKYFCEILAGMGETHSASLKSALCNDDETLKWTAENLIELLLQCSEQPGRYPTDETRSCIPFGFWYSLQDNLSDQLVYEDRAMQILKPTYTRLVHALLRKSTLPSSPSEAGDAEEQELFRCYRQDVADTIGYCYRVLEQDLLVLLGQRLSQALDNSEKWTHVEAILHAFEATSDNFSYEDECQYIPALMDLILTRIPYDHYPGEVLARVCSTMGAYAEWIGEHPDPWLGKVLQIVILSLTKGSVSASLASMALRDLTRECKNSITPYTPSILTTIEQLLPTVTPGDQEGLRLMFIAGQVLDTLPTIEEQLIHLDATLGLCIIKIQELLKQPLFTARVAVTNHMKMITKFFAALESTPRKSLLDALLPIFNQIISHPEWSQDNATLEEMYTCAQKSLTSLLHPEVDALPLLQILTSSYKNWPHPAALNLLRQLVLLLRRHPNNVMGPVFAEVSSITLSGVRACKSVRGNLSDWSELLEAYFSMLSQICKKSAELFLQVPDQIPEMLQYGMDCLPLPEIRTGKAAADFFHGAIIRKSHLQTFIQPIGQQLVSVILRCAAVDVLRHHLDPYMEVLYALFKTHSKVWTEQWVRVAIEQATQFRITTAQKEYLMRDVFDPNRVRLLDTLKDISLHNLTAANNSIVTP